MDIIIEGLIYIIYLITLLAALVFVYWLYNSVLRSRKKELDDSLFEKVAYIVTEYRTLDELMSHVLNFQSRNVDKKYRVLEEYELNVVKEILEKFRKDVSKKYFNRNLTINKEISKFSKEEYFMFSLCSFLREKECEAEFNGNETIKYISHEPYLGGTATLYEFTDYGRSYMKLLYVASEYCRMNETINATFIYRSKDIKENLDNDQITICRYRP